MENFRILLQQIKKTIIALRASIYGVSNVKEINFIIKNFDRLWVQSGPFKGMRYINSSYGSAWHPKILGTYEKELADLVCKLAFKKYKKIIDIGCAEGYYLAGLARLAAKSGASPEIIGYDLNEGALEMARSLMAINGVQGHAINQRFHFDNLAGEPNFYLIDIEGDERELLEGLDVDQFRSSEFLIEVHEPRGHDELLNFLKNLFFHTHKLTVVYGKARDVTDFPIGFGIRTTDRLKLEVMDEQRCYGNVWLFAENKNRE